MLICHCSLFVCDFFGLNKLLGVPQRSVIFTLTRVKNVDLYYNSRSVFTSVLVLDIQLYVFRINFQYFRFEHNFRYRPRRVFLRPK